MQTQSFVTFYLDNQLYGLDIWLIREINKYTDISPVPHAKPHLKGLINLRGQIVTVIDLKHRLGIGNSQLLPTSHNVILKSNTELQGLAAQQTASGETLSIPDKVGLFVDDISDVIAVNREEIDAPPANLKQVDSKYLLGVVKLPGMLLSILNAREVLQYEA